MDRIKGSPIEPHTVIGTLLVTMRLHRKRTERFVRESGLHPTQHRLLMYLARREEPCRQKELAEHFELTPAAVAQILDKLEGEGYVTREHTDEDCRCKRITLTKKGWDTAEKSRIAFREIDARVCRGVDYRDMETFCRVLVQMQENLQSESEGKEKQ